MTLEQFLERYPDVKCVDSAHLQGLPLTRANRNESRAQLRVHVQHKDDPSMQLIVFFCDETKLSTAVMKKWVEEMENEQLSHAIVVYQTDISPSAKKVRSSPTAGAPSERHLTLSPRSAPIHVLRDSPSSSSSTLRGDRALLLRRPTHLDVATERPSCSSTLPSTNLCPSTSSSHPRKKPSCCSATA